VAVRARRPHNRHDFCGGERIEHALLRGASRHKSDVAKVVAVEMARRLERRVVLEGLLDPRLAAWAAARVHPKRESGAGDQVQHGGTVSAKHALGVTVDRDLEANGTRGSEGHTVANDGGLGFWRLGSRGP